MELSPAGSHCLRQTIQEACGLVLPPEKDYIIHQRLEPLAAGLGCRSLDELAALLRQDAPAGLRRQVISAITTKETSFFRDEHPWRVLAETVLPALAAAPRPGAALRCLVAGAATGQEVYSLAMLAAETAPTLRRRAGGPVAVRILALEISPRALEQARAGVYSAFETSRGLAPARRERFFEEAPGGLRVRDELREGIEFREANLTGACHDLGRFDLILCRNVLIYFDRETKGRVFARLHALLHPWGRLLLGATENTYHVTDLFVSERHGKTLFYRRRERAHP
jgi:chemotaxis protein methyltransferase CheR